MVFTKGIPCKDDCGTSLTTQAQLTLWGQRLVATRCPTPEHQPGCEWKWPNKLCFIGRLGWKWTDRVQRVTRVTRGWQGAFQRTNEYGRCITLQRCYGDAIPEVRRAFIQTLTLQLMGLKTEEPFQSSAASIPILTCGTSWRGSGGDGMVYWSSVDDNKTRTSLTLCRKRTGFWSKMHWVAKVLQRQSMKCDKQTMPSWNFDQRRWSSAQFQ